MIQVFSADNNWAIGRDNQLLFRTKGDMTFFRKTTTGGVVVMGRKTLESLPGGKPLPDRVNIVLSRREDYAPPGVTVCSSLLELFAALAPWDDEKIFIIGGAEIYSLLLPYSKKALVTRFDAEKEADARVANLDQTPGWQLIYRSEIQMENDLSYRWCTYRQTQPRDWRLEA